MMTMTSGRAASSTMRPQVLANHGGVDLNGMRYKQKAARHHVTGRVGGAKRSTATGSTKAAAVPATATQSHPQKLHRSKQVPTSQAAAATATDAVQRLSNKTTSSATGGSTSWNKARTMANNTKRRPPPRATKGSIPNAARTVSRLRVDPNLPHLASRNFSESTSTATKTRREAADAVQRAAAGAYPAGGAFAGKKTRCKPNAASWRPKSVSCKAQRAARNSTSKGFFSTSNADGLNNMKNDTRVRANPELPNTTATTSTGTTAAPGSAAPASNRRGDERSTAPQYSNNLTKSNNPRNLNSSSTSTNNSTKKVQARNSKFNLTALRAMVTACSACYLRAPTGRRSNIASGLSAPSTPRGCRLDLSMKMLTQCPPDVARVPDLVEVLLTSNSIDTFPTSLRSAVRLAALSLSWNKIAHVPRAIIHFRALVKLDLGFNLLQEVPIELCALPKLRQLALNDNSLCSLPVEIGNLSSLIELNLNYNRIEDLPVQLTNLTALTTLCLSGNPLKEPSPAIAFEGIDGIFRFLRNKRRRLTAPPAEEEVAAIPAEIQCEEASPVERRLGEEMGHELQHQCIVRNGLRHSVATYMRRRHNSRNGNGKHDRTKKRMYGASQGSLTLEEAQQVKNVAKRAAGLASLDQLLRVNRKEALVAATTTASVPVGRRAAAAAAGVTASTSADSTAGSSRDDLLGDFESTLLSIERKIDRERSNRVCGGSRLSKGRGNGSGGSGARAEMADHQSDADGPLGRDSASASRSRLYQATYQRRWGSNGARRESRSATVRDSECSDPAGWTAESRLNEEEASYVRQLLLDRGNFSLLSTLDDELVAECGDDATEDEKLAEPRRCDVTDSRRRQLQQQQVSIEGARLSAGDRAYIRSILRDRDRRVIARERPSPRHAGDVIQSNAVGVTDATSQLNEARGRWRRLMGDLGNEDESKEAAGDILSGSPERVRRNEHDSKSLVESMSAGIDIENAPQAFVCPITYCVMANPVVASDGHTYEEAAIRKWISMRDRSPMTGEPLASKTLTPNHILRSMISDFVSKNKKA